MKIICAWCLQEAGEKPRETDLHGICRAHANQMLKECRRRRLAQKGGKR